MRDEFPSDEDWDSMSPEERRMEIDTIREMLGERTSYYIRLEKPKEKIHAEIGIIFNELFNTDLLEYEMHDVIVAFHLSIATRIAHKLIEEDKELAKHQ